MKLPCSVIEDLLPLYHDSVCSDESKTLVEEHLRECAACKDALHSLKEELTLEDPERAKPLLSISMSWNKEKRKAFLRGAYIALAICVILISTLIGQSRWKCVPMPSADLVVGQVCQLEDGSIYYELGSRYQDFGGTWEFQLTEDGSCYFICKKSILEPKIDDETDPYTYFSDIFYPDGSGPSLLNHNTDFAPITAFYFGAPDDCLLVWEQGMELPPAQPETP